MDDEDLELSSYAWSWRSTAAATGALVTHLLEDAARFTRHVTEQIIADHNYRIDRRNFMESAAREIETITSEE